MLKSELIEISTGVYVLEDKIKCELGITDYLKCDKFRRNTKGCINCDCVRIDVEDKYSPESMANELQDCRNRINQLEADKLEAYQAIVEFNRMYKFETGEEILKESVLKAEEYIVEVTK